MLFLTSSSYHGPSIQDTRFEFAAFDSCDEGLQNPHIQQAKKNYLKSSEILVIILFSTSSSYHDPSIQDTRFAFAAFDSCDEGLQNPHIQQAKKNYLKSSEILVIILFSIF